MAIDEKTLKWAKRYMSMAYLVGSWTSCLSRKVGCVITVNRRVVATGYNGAPAGVPSCTELGYCLRQGSKSGENLEQCQAVHAEQNAITWAAKYGVALEGADIYVTTYPCITCMKLIVASGIKRLFYTEEYNSPLARELAEKAGIETYQIQP